MIVDTLMVGAGIDKKIYLSVVIRTRNSARSLKALFEALTAQKCSFSWELVVVDNDSKDETPALCELYKAHAVFISQAEFTPGRALNLGISRACGDLILLCSPHSIPVGSEFLEKAAAPFADPQMAAVRCLHAANKEQMARWYKPQDIQYHSLSEQQSAESGIDWISRYPSATCCVIRRSLWEIMPYDETLESIEDKYWVSKILSKGFKIRSPGEAVFVYNRTRSRTDALKNKTRAFRALYRVTGFVPMTWPQFFRRTLKFCILSPLAAVRYLVENIGNDFSSVTVPWQAKFPAVSGSFREYRKDKSLNGQ